MAGPIKAKNTEWGEEGGVTNTTLNESMGDIGILRNFVWNTCISLYLGRKICDSENKNGHAWLSATSLEDACMELEGWGGAKGDRRWMATPKQHWGCNSENCGWGSCYASNKNGDYVILRKRECVY